MGPCPKAYGATERLLGVGGGHLGHFKQEMSGTWFLMEVVGPGGMGERDAPIVLEKS